jgi:predicted dehydrogenase
LAALVDPAAQKSTLYEEIKAKPVYADLESCLAEHKADLVILSSPIQYHAGQIKQALAHGAHVLCEKPLCATREQALELIQLQQESGLHVGVGYQWSFSRAIQNARKDVLNGLYGKPLELRTRVYWPRNLAYYARNNWAGRLELDGLPVYDSVLHNATAHYLHNMLFFIGESQYDAALPELIEGRLMRAHDIETFDTALVRMEKTLPDGDKAILAIAVSHCPEQLFGPDLDYRFSNGSLAVEDGRVVGIQNPGTFSEMSVDYGQIVTDDPVGDKVDDMLDVILGKGEEKKQRRAPVDEEEEEERRPLCDVQTAYAQTAVVATLHEQCEIEMADPATIQRFEKDGEQWVAVRGLDQKMDQFIATLELPERLV